MGTFSCMTSDSIGWRKYLLPSGLNAYIYLLLAEFSVRTVHYEPSFFPSIYGPSAKRAGHKSMEKNEDPSFKVRTEKTRLIRCLLYGFFLFGRPETSAGRTI